jgi:hypothetical protein
MSASGSNSVYNALPSLSEGLDADGTFSPVVNVVNNTFSTPTNVSDPPFNNILIGNSATNVVGSATTPYIPAALPAYIPTLYSNVYNIQSNLTNVISTSDVSDNRVYPSVFAVKNFVQSQLSGSERLTAGSATISRVSTGVSNTVLIGAPTTLTNSAPNVGVFQDASGVNVITNFFDMNAIDSARNGSTKIIINSSTLNTNYFMTIQLTGNKYFVVNGKKYRTYQFTMLGDALNLCQFISPANGDNIFFVLSYGGLFSNLVE